MLQHTSRIVEVATLSVNLTGLVACAIVGAMVVSRGSTQAVPASNPASGTGGRSTARTVLITGANRGIGFEFARQYQQAGWNVIATVRDKDKAEELNALGGGGVVHVETLDVTDGKSVSALADRLKSQPIDLLINNAGVGAIGNRLSDVKIEEFEHVLQVNAIGPVRTTQALIKNVRSGTAKTIVNITSVLGSVELNTGGGLYGYREGKAALNMFTRSIAAELRRDGIICIVMHPGWVKTDMGGANAQLMPEESVRGMRKVIDGLKPDDSGAFWSYDGKRIPW